MAEHAAIAGLYAVTPDDTGEDVLQQRCAQALGGGARILQYRDKSTDHARRARLAAALAALCREHGALFIVNDDVDLAVRSGAHGVHLGRDDAPIKHARGVLGADAGMGASCYDDLGRAERAAAAGADYLAFGSFFPSRVKPSAVRPSLELLREARRRFGLPLVAIGGITADNAGAVVQAGADAIAVVTALFDAADTWSAAQSLARAFEHDANALS
jgi:thiamine-phosphate pyrophosphorylase